MQEESCEVAMMTINSEGIAAASKAELLAIWLYDNDLFRTMFFGEWLYRCKVLGVSVNG